MELMKLLFAHQLTKLMIVLPIAITANILLGYGSAKLQDKLDYDKLIKGLIRGLYVYSAIVLWVIITLILPDIKIELGNEVVTVIQATIVIIYGSIVYYAQSFVGNIADLFKKEGK